MKHNWPQTAELRVASDGVIPLLGGDLAAPFLTRPAETLWGGKTILWAHPGHAPADSLLMTGSSAIWPSVPR
jgi:hypothetical protein